MKKSHGIKTDLSLPLEYQQLPEYFDAHNISDDTDAKNAVIEKLLKKQNVKTILDLSCGTGSQVFFLAKHGYKIIGADFSAPLLDIARKKAKYKNIDIEFIDGDMRTLKVGEFDAVITIFNAIGHLSKIDLGKAISNIHKNSKSGGIYIFDIFNLQAITDEVVEGLKIIVKKLLEILKFTILKFRPQKWPAYIIR